MLTDLLPSRNQYDETDFQLPALTGNANPSNFHENHVIFRISRKFPDFVRFRRMDLRIQVSMDLSIQVSMDLRIHVSKDSRIQVLKESSIQVFKYSGISLVPKSPFLRYSNLHSLHTRVSIP